MAVTRKEKPETTESLPKNKDPGSSRVDIREWSVEVVGGPDKGQKFKTLGALVRVGSDPTNDLVLTDPTVSRRHVEFERMQNGLVVRDMGSRNGAVLEGRRVLSAFIEPGDKVTIGKTKLNLKVENKATSVEILGGESFGDLVGASEHMRTIFAELRRLARDDSNLLIEGETGTGKELAARAVHAHSARRHGPFKVVDCNLITEENAERELFGLVRGPTEASKPGVFESASGGTVYLDEIGELKASLQPKLLRMLETREVQRGGGGESKPLDVRIIASTHKNLDEEVRQSRFRADLYFRVAKTKVRLPPLRTRREDIQLLARHFVKGLSGNVDLSPQTLSLLEQYDWPGNVRELRNVVERAALMQETGSTNWLDFLTNPPKKGAQPSSSVHAQLSNLAYHEAKDRVLADFERVYFAEVMKEAGFDIKVAEGKTGLSMQSLYRLLKKNGLRLKDLKNAGDLKDE
ncbi:MAG: sigma 54-interacting transcriptional regulator [Myxococcaceae bacterium]